VEQMDSVLLIIRLDAAGKWIALASPLTAMAEGADSFPGGL